MLVVLISLYAPMSARAQTVPHRVTPAQTVAAPARWPGVLAEVGGGVLGSGLSLLIAQSLLDDSSCGSSGGCISRGIGAAGTYVLSSMLLVPAGVTLGGRMLDHRGGFGASLLGALMGVLVGGLLGFGLSAAVSDADSDVKTGLAIGSVVVFSVGGSALMYELSAP